MPSGTRILITGATGFIGRWALWFWRKNHPEVEIWATSEQPQPPAIESHTYVQTDLCDYKATEELVKRCKPNQVIHLAGVISNADFKKLLCVNVAASECLYKSLAEECNRRELKIIQATSAATYGSVTREDLPINEEQPFRPVSYYGLSKVMQDQLAMTMWRSHGLNIVRACIFNILGPNQPASLVPATFLEQLLNIRQTGAKVLKVGRIDSRRDFVDVRDVVRAFDLLLAKGISGEAYNIASGQDINIRDMIYKLMEVAELDIPLEADATRFHAMEVPVVRADISKIVKATGWKPGISLDESLKEMWESAGNRQGLESSE